MLMDYCINKKECRYSNTSSNRGYDPIIGDKHSTHEY